MSKVQSYKSAPAGERLLQARAEFPTKRQLLTLLVAYFVVHVIIRTILSSSADLDEAEQALLTEQWSWGYGAQPPLYTWIQIVFFYLFTPSIFALSLFKNLLLLFTYLMVFANARLITRSDVAASAAAISLLLIPLVSWESQRDLTHSVLASFFAVTALYCFLQLWRQRSSSWYLLFGLCCGFGLLAKFNFAFWFLGLLLAGLTQREVRPAVLDLRMLFALGLCLVIILPSALWILNHRDLAFSAVSKFSIQKADPWFKTVFLGFRRLLQTIGSFLGPLALIYCALFWRSRWSKQDAQGNYLSLAVPIPIEARFMLRTFLIIGVALAVMIFGFRATNLRDRWLQPVLICSPVLAVTLAGHRLDQRRLKYLAGIGLVVALIVTCAMPGRILLAERLHREQPLNRPYPELAASLKSILLPSTMVVADTAVLAGNLRLALPGQQVLVPGLERVFSPRGKSYVLVWEVSEASGASAPPYKLIAWARSMDANKALRAQPRYLSATYKFHTARKLRLAVLQLD